MTAPLSKGTLANQQTSIQPSSTSALQAPRLSFNDAVHTAVKRQPEVAQSISRAATQNAYIDVAKAEYYPQISGGISTGDFTTGERGR